MTADRKKLEEYLRLQYFVELRFDKEVGRWFVNFPELQGCEADGATREEALLRGDEVKAVWLETALERGRAIPEPESEPAYSGRFMLRIPRTLHERAARLANREGVSLNALLVQIVTQGVERFGLRSLFGIFDAHMRKAIRNAVMQGGEGAYQAFVGIALKRIHHSETVIPESKQPVLPDKGSLEGGNADGQS